MPSVSGASSTQNESQIAASQQAEVQDNKKLDQAALQAQQAQQDQQAQQATGQNSAQMYEALRQAAMANLPQGPAQEPPKLGPTEAKMAKGVAAMVMQQLFGNLSSMNQNTQQGGDAQGGGITQGGGASTNEEAGGQRMGGMQSNMSNFQADADSQIQKAAQSTIYKDVADMMKGMQGKLQQKQAIGEAVSTYNQLLAKKWEGTKNMPVYEMDEKTGQMKMVGKKAMTYEEATAERDKWRDTKDSISELNQQDMLMLQQGMDKMHQLESMISNCMKAYADTQNTLAQALKA